MVLNNAPNNNNFTVKKATEHNILGCNFEGKEIKKWTSEIVVIMDSNRKFIVPEKLFPDKKTTILKCGNISSLNRIAEDPYFYDVESIVMQFSDADRIIVHLGSHFSTFQITFWYFPDPILVSFGSHFST